MRLSTCLPILVSVYLLTSCGGGGGGGKTTIQTAPLDIPAKLDCKGSKEVHIGDKQGTVIFSVPDSCAPLESITPDPPVPGFTHKATPNGTITYWFPGGKLPDEGYPFSYTPAKEEVGVLGGTGVVKN